MPHARDQADPADRIRIPEAAWSVVGVAGGPVAGVVVAALALRVADAAAYGTYSLAMSFIIAGSVAASLGMQQRAIPWLGGLDPSPDRRRVLLRIQVGLVASGFGTGLLVALLVSLGTRLGHLSGLSAGVAGLVAVGCTAQTALVFGREVRRGLGRVRAAALLGPAMIGTLSASILAVLAFRGMGLDGRGLTMVGVGSTLVLATVSVTGMLWRPGGPFLRGIVGEFRAWLRPSLPFGWVSVLIVVDSQIGLWVVAALADHPADVGVMAVGLKLSLAFGLPAGTVAYAASHHIARRTASAAGPEMAGVLRTPIRLSAGVTGLGLLVAALVGQRIVSFALGPDVTEAAGIAVILGVGYLARSIVGPANQVLLYAGRWRLSLVPPSAGIVIAVVLGWIGMVTVGLMGAAAGVAASWVAQAALNDILMRRALGWSFTASS